MNAPLSGPTPIVDANLIYVGGYYYVAPERARNLERLLAEAVGALERAQRCMGLKFIDEALARIKAAKEQGNA